MVDPVLWDYRPRSVSCVVHSPRLSEQFAKSNWRSVMISACAPLGPNELADRIVLHFGAEHDGELRMRLMRRWGTGDDLVVNRLLCWGDGVK